MAAPLLITTFAPWRAHQPSNTSDDLIQLLAANQALPPTSQVMRHVPVSFDLAPSQVIAQMVQCRPQVVVCCGMAETRQQLNLELNGKRDDHVVRTHLNLSVLLANTVITSISHCAGTYVCNHLYYELLTFIQRHQWPAQALFIHIPCLTDSNRPWLMRDLTLILQRLSTEPSRSSCRPIPQDRPAALIETP